MSKIIFDFVGGKPERNKRIGDAMRKELTKLGADPYRTPGQRQREADIDSELEDQREDGEG
jgi:hypothetical protein|tara:strand:+ start:3784 stop:3966 length:183 start_codon:yes stop_codon:yes gene_type:complete